MLPEVNQVVIMAGGFGTRMSSAENPLRCKSLIEYGGQSMIGYLLDAVRAAGISNVIVATNKHSHVAIQDIVMNKGMINVLVIVADGEPVAGKPEFSAVPYELRNLLSDRFILVCGHHPVSESHLRVLRNESRIHDYVLTGYPNRPMIDQKLFDREGDLRRIVIDSAKKFKEVSLGESLNSQYYYARNPYVVSRKLVEKINEYTVGYVKTFSHAIYNFCREEKATMGIVIADMPPEFDYDFEYEEMKQYLDQSRKKST